MDVFGSIGLGFSVALTVKNLIACFVGALLGTVIGVLPGIGPLATMALLLPLTYGLEPTTSLIMLAGIYYGAQYGGSTTAILVSVPGEASSLVTVLDGHQMARNGRAGQALAVAALGSLFAGTVGTLMIALGAPTLAKFTLKFGSPEYFSLMVLGLITAVVLANGPVLKAIAMVLIGIVLGLVGTDTHSGLGRFHFGIPEFMDGIDFIVIGIGLFGVTEIIGSLSRGADNTEIKPVGVQSSRFALLGEWMLSREEFRRAWPASVRGTALGSVLGILPGGGALLASFASYIVEKKVSRNPDEFGKGAIEGVAGPESANNAGAQTSFIPLLTLGLPSNAIMAMMAGAMMIHNITPGPTVMTQRPDLFWGLIASMWIGNLMLLVLNLPLIGIWVKLLNIPYRLLYPAILFFCAIGVYGAASSVNLIYATAATALIGVVLARLGFEPAPLVLGFVMGPLMEEHFRRAMRFSRGDLTVFFTEPISLGLLVIALLMLALMAMPAFKRNRKAAFADDAA